MALRSWTQRARSWRAPSSVKTVAQVTTMIAAFAAAVICVAQLPDRYASALQATGGLALLGVTAIYVSHTRRQAEILAAQARVQVAAPRVATLRELLTKMGEWRGRESMLHLRMQMLATMLSTSGAFEWHFAKTHIPEWFAELDDSLAIDVQEALRLAAVDLPDSLEELSRTIARTAREEQVVVLQFANLVSEAIEAGGTGPYSSENIATTWEKSFRLPPTEWPKWPRWNEISEGGLDRRITDVLPPFEAEARRLVREPYAITDLL